MSERLKHRVIGVLVIASLLVIFVPAMLKNSNHNFEKNIKIALKLPSKPNLPKVDVPNNKELFKSVNVVKPQKIKVAKIQKNLLIAKAEPLEIKHFASRNSNIASIANNKFNNDKTYIKVAANGQQNTQKPEKLSANTLNASNVNKVTNAIKIANSSQSTFFSIQVATFTQKNNADLLVEKLKNKGFSAVFNSIKNDKGVVLYQVVVGKVSQREQALDLQKKLASTMQLNGFIIKSEVS